MTISNINLYTAQQLMRLKNSTGLMSFVTTVWNGTSIMIVWNTLASDIMQIWDEAAVNNEDRETLRNIVRDFLQRELPQ
jgi:hypothetical protein